MATARSSDPERLDEELKKVELKSTKKRHRVVDFGKWREFWVSGI